jgi:hypothetical protein
LPVDTFAILSFVSVSRALVTVGMDSLRFFGPPIMMVRLSALLRDAGEPKEQQGRLSRWLERISELKNSLVAPE